MAATAPFTLPKDSEQPQYILYYPPGTTIIGDESVPNKDIAERVLCGLQAGQSVAIAEIEGAPGWHLYQVVGGEIRPVHPQSTPVAPIARCDACGRGVASTLAVGAKCNFPAPEGACQGTFRATS